MKNIFFQEEGKEVNKRGQQLESNVYFEIRYAKNRKMGLSNNIPKRVGHD